MDRLRRFATHRRRLLSVLGIILALLVGARLWPHPPLKGWKPSSVAVTDAQGRLLRLVLASDERYRLWIPLSDISPQLVDAVLLHEDNWFWWHPGFNPYGLLRGGWVTYVRHGSRQGGSTITMQLARLLEPMNTRSPAGKALQVARAVQLELFYSKRDILEAYLNYAPYGHNVEGVGAASIAYFDHPAAALSLPEALALAVLPQDPGHRLQSGARDIISAPLSQARNRLFEEWLRDHPQDEALRPLFALPLTMRPLSRLPFEAPHAVEQLLQARRMAADGDVRVTSTIDLGLQHILERQINRYVAHSGNRGITNASAILVDTSDMGIRALVGSSDYFNRDLHGQVNGTLARRSPGSTLKPFIYALGFDQGLLHPQTVLRDVPTSFGPYTPENFDGEFLGPITATDALNRSRNIPAVWIASQLHSPDLYQFLQGAGVSPMASAEHYGLALVLGGGEVSMQDEAGLYAMLVNGGSLKPLRLDTAQPRTAGTQLLSPQASFMVMDILRQHMRPDETTGAQPVRTPIYWKTGTSWAFRDAWTAGVFGPYVLVVWIGNFDGSGNPAFVGADAAAPLFFQIIDAVQAEHPRLPQPAGNIPSGVKSVEICLASGELPNQWCPQRGRTWFIPGKSPIKVSDVHRAVMMDDATGRPACPPYQGKRLHQELFEFWPSDLLEVFAKAGIPRRRPPSNPDCTNAGALEGEPPRITSPIRGASYVWRVSQQDRQKIPLSAVTDADVRTLYWFAGDAFIGSSRPGETLFWQPASAGSYALRAVDDQGRSDERPLEVDLVQ